MFLSVPPITSLRETIGLHSVTNLQASGYEYAFVVTMTLIASVVLPAVWSRLPDRRLAAVQVLDRLIELARLLFRR